MRKIKISDLHNYQGSVLAQDLFFKGFLLLKEGTKLDAEVIGKLKNAEDYFHFVFIEGDEIPQIDEFFGQEIMSKMLVSIEETMRTYSFDGHDDIETVKEIITSIVDSIFVKRIFSNFNLDTFFSHSPSLYSHSLNTAILTTLLAVKSARFNRETLKHLTLGALLHDIGLTSLASNATINFYTYDTSTPEWRNHPIVGYEMLKDSDLDPLVSKVTLYHHVWQQPERSYNFLAKQPLSYPVMYKDNRLFPEKKGLLVSIVQVADTFECMTNLSNPEAVSKKEAISHIITNREKIYGDGAVLLKNYISPYGIGDSVLLSNGKKATVLKQTFSPDDPIVELETGEEVDLSKTPKLYVQETI